MFTVSADELKQAIAIVSKSVARDDMRPVLAGIHRRGCGASVDVVAADGFRLSIVRVPVLVGSYDEQAVVNAKQFAAALRAGRTLPDYELRESRVY